MCKDKGVLLLHVHVHLWSVKVPISCLGILHIYNFWILMRKIVIYLLGRTFYLRGNFCFWNLQKWCHSSPVIINWLWFIGTAQVTDVDSQVYEVIQSIYDTLLEFINKNHEAWAPIIAKVIKSRSSFEKCLCVCVCVWGGGGCKVAHQEFGPLRIITAIDHFAEYIH